MPTVTTNNIKINYVEHGAGDEVIIFIHGYCGSLGNWREVLKRLPKEYHAYALDLRGHGQSDISDSYQLADMVEDIYAFGRELAIGQFTYVGHSLGGKIGYQYALNHPKTLKAMVLAAPAPAHDFIPADQRTSFIDMVSAAFGSAEGMQLFFSQTANPPSEELLNELINDALMVDPTARKECAIWWTSTNLETQLGDISVPTLIIAGAKDDLPLEFERRYANAIKGCRFEVFEDSGHFIPMDDSQKLVDLLTSFIKDVDTMGAF